MDDKSLGKDCSELSAKSDSGMKAITGFGSASALDYREGRHASGETCEHQKDAKLARTKTRPVSVGNVVVGGGAPVVVQSMTNAPMIDEGEGPHLDVPANLAQIRQLAQAGCELVRVAIPNKLSIGYFGELVSTSPLPVIADVHFDHEIALGAIWQGAAAVRINPGNISSVERVDCILDAAGQADIPIRIGVNAGSLEQGVAEREDMSLPEKLALSACGFVDHCASRGFLDLVVSAKSHDVSVCIDAYRLLSKELPQVPLHIGVTEAGGIRQGTVKSALALGTLLREGIGDTMRVSLTADPTEEISVAFDILSASGVRRVSPELVSCPTCSRCQVDLVSIAQEVSSKISALKKPLQVAVMGCVVNGPGEARDADVGVACGRECGVLFAHGKKLSKVPADRIVDSLIELCESQ